MVGPLQIAWHSVLSLLGALVAGAIAVRLSRRLVKDDRVYAYAIAVLVGGLITARLGNVADNWAQYGGSLERILALGGGGIAVTAAPIGSAVAGVLAARVLRLPVGFMLDVASLGILAGLAIGRIGDVINGEHHAVACSGLAWCVRYTHPETLGQSHFVHPVVAYDALLNLGILAVAFLFWRRVRGHPPEGRVFWLVLGLYGTGRFLTSFLRLDPVVLWGLQEAQLLGAVYAVTATGVIGARGRPRD